MVRIQKSGTIIRIRDNGIPFNPLDYNPAGNGDDIEYQIGGINILKRWLLPLNIPGRWDLII